jgi:hypothetical protein
LVVPRNVRRLARVTHAFGPVTLAAFHVSGGGAEQACFEDDFGLGSPIVIDAAVFARRLESALSAERIPFAVVAGDLADQALEQGKWTIVACAGGLGSEIRAALERGVAAGRPISIGPHPADRDAIFQPLKQPFRVPEQRGIPALLGLEEASLREAVRAAKSSLGLYSEQCSTEGVFVTVHRNDAGEPRVAFLINPSARALRAELSLPGVARASDALDGSEFRARTGLLEVPLPPQTVRMLELFA